MANNLYEYYQSKGEALPTVQQRQGVATEAGITDYKGTKEQNVSLLGYLTGASKNNVITPEGLTQTDPLKTKEPVADTSSVGIGSSIGTLLKNVEAQKTKDQADYDTKQAEYLKSIEASGNTSDATEKIIKDNSVDILKRQSDTLASDIEAEQLSASDQIAELRKNPEGLSASALNSKISDINYKSAQILARKGIALSAINRQYDTASNIANRAITANTDRLKADLEAKKFILEQIGTSLATDKAQAFTIQLKQIDNEEKMLQDAVKTATDGMNNGTINNESGGSAIQDLVSGKISISDFYKQINTDPTNTTGSNVAGYDITSYATDPTHEQKVLSIYSSIPFVSDAKSAQSAIDRLSPNSPITGEMVIASAKKYGVDPSLMLAIMQQDSSLGTAGLGAKTMNAGNVGNDDAGNIKKFNSWGEGVDAVAQWLSNHPSENTSTDYIFGDFTTTLSPQGATVFNKLPSNDKTTVMQLVSGDALIADLVRSRGEKGTKEIERITNLAKQVDPAFSINSNKIKFQAKQQWNNPNGKAFLTRSAMNTAMSHMALTYESAKMLGNSEIPKWNDLQNWFSKNTGNPELTNFVYDLTALAGEVASAYKNGTAPSELDTQRFYDAMTGSMSPEQFKGVFTQSSQLMAGKLKSLAQEYKQSTGAYPADPIIQPSVLEELKSSGVDTAMIDELLQAQGYQNNSLNYDTGLGMKLAQLEITDGGNNTLLIPRTQWSKLTATHDDESGLSRADALLKTLKDSGYNLLVK